MQEAESISYDLPQSPLDPDSWFVYDNWRSSADLDAHMQTAYIKTFLNLAPSLMEGDIELQRFTMISPRSVKSGTSFSGKKTRCHGSQW